MDKKIKSVKLRHNYRTANKFLPAGTILIPNGDFWMTDNIDPNESFKILSFHNSDIIECETDLFNVEYHSIKKWITVKIEYEFNDYKLSAGDVQCALADYNTKRTDKLLYFNNLTVTEIK